MIAFGNRLMKFADCLIGPATGIAESRDSQRGRERNAVTPPTVIKFV